VNNVKASSRFDGRNNEKVQYNKIDINFPIFIINLNYFIKKLSEFKSYQNPLY